MDGSSELERRLIAEAPGLEVRQSENGRTVIRGYAALYNSDSQDLGGFVERIMPGAFDAVLAKNPDVFGRYNHERLLARTSSGTMKLELDERGLRYTIYPKKADADLVESIERGDVRGSSFAFRSSGANERWFKDDAGRMIREIRSFDFLGDAGPVDNPAYPATEAFVSRRALEFARNEQRAIGVVVEDSAQPVPAQAPPGDSAVEAGVEKRAAAVIYEAGDFVAWDGGVGRIEYVMAEGQIGDYSAEPVTASADDPAALVRKYEFEDGYWEECDEFVAKNMSELVAASGIMGEVPAFIDSMPDERAVGLKPTAGMAAAAKRGLRLHEEGKSGDGLKPETVARANRLARREEMNPDWVREMNAWFARHYPSSTSDGWDKAPDYSPFFVAYLLWGGTPARNWAARKVAEMKRASERAAGDKSQSTPAPKEDQIEGSEKNKPGSAKDASGEISVSPSTREALATKVSDHNDEMEKAGKPAWTRATIGQLLAVYRRGAGAYSTSHRPGVSRGAWAMARVNAYLYLLSSGSPRDSKYTTDNDLLPPGHPKASKAERSLDIQSQIGALKAALLRTHLHGK